MKIKDPFKLYQDNDPKHQRTLQGHSKVIETPSQKTDMNPIKFMK